MKWTLGFCLQYRVKDFQKCVVPVEFFEIVCNVRCKVSKNQEILFHTLLGIVLDCGLCVPPVYGNHHVGQHLISTPSTAPSHQLHRGYMRIREMKENTI